MNGWQELLLISAALKTKLLQSIAGKPQTAEELAASNGYDLRAVELVMEALRELGLVTAVRAHYQLTKNASKYVDQNDPDYVANALLHSTRLIANWTKLPEAIKTGKSQSQRRSPQELEIFVRSMDEYSKHYAEQAVSLILDENKDAKTALDLGGALGTFSKPLADKGLKVTLMDTEAVANLSRKYINNPLIKIIAGDFTQELVGGPYDIILMSNIVHIYNPDKLEALFSRAQEKLATDGLVAIIDFVRDKSPNAAMFGVNMLVHTAGGGTWTLSQYERWLRHGGLNLRKTIDLKDADQKLLIADGIRE